MNHRTQDHPIRRVGSLRLLRMTALSGDIPVPFAVAGLRNDAELAILRFVYNSPESVRARRARSALRLRERASAIGTERGRELRGSHPQCRSLPLVELEAPGSISVGLHPWGRRLLRLQAKPSSDFGV